MYALSCTLKTSQVFKEKCSERLTTNFFQILKKYMEGNTKKITFENFLRALKWAEQASIDDKIRGIWNMLSVLLLYQYCSKFTFNANLLKSTNICIGFSLLTALQHYFCILEDVILVKHKPNLTTIINAVAKFIQQWC